MRGREDWARCINQLLSGNRQVQAADEGHVFVITAANFRNKVDPALARSDRLGMCLEVPLLDSREARRPLPGKTAIEHA